MLCKGSVYERFMTLKKTEIPFCKIYATNETFALTLFPKILSYDARVPHLYTHWETKNFLKVLDGVTARSSTSSFSCSK